MNDMNDTVDPDDIGEFPAGFVNPITNPDLPWITAYDDENADPVPEDRLEDEPGWIDFAGAEDNGQNERVAPAALLSAFLPNEEEDADSGEKPRRAGYVPSAVGGINLRDYSRTPSGKGWGSPCSGQRARVTVGAAAVSVDVRVAELVGLIMRNAESRGYRHRAADTGAYNCRKIGGTNTWSNHAWALAIDINWQSNPFVSPLRTDIPEWYRHLFNRYGFAWGGDYSGKKDAMHFEFMGTPAQAVAATNLARAELSGGGGGGGGGGGTTWQPRVDAPLGQRILEKWMVGSDVAFVQRWHGIEADGYFGDGTVTAVRATQARNGLMVDGQVGPATWRVFGIGTAPAPAPQAPPFPLPKDEYFGLITGPNESHGGATDTERTWVMWIQQALIRKGYAGTSTRDPNATGWDDGRFEQATKDAVTRFQRAEMPGTTRFGEVWFDDWAVLLRP